MKLLKRLVAIVLCLSALAGLLSVTALAGNMCDYVEGSKDDISFTVTTADRGFLKAKIKFQQKKGQRYGYKWSSYLVGKKKKTKWKAFGRYYITITDTETGRVVKRKEWTSKSYTFAFKKKGRTYRIDIEFGGDASGRNYAGMKWSQYPTFSVTKTRHITMCTTPKVEEYW